MFENFRGKTDQESKTVFTRRMVVLGGCKAFLTTLVMGRLGYLGLIRGSHYRNLADGNRIKLQILLPKRGFIRDRRGVELATTKMCYRLIILPNETEDLRDTLHRLHHAFPHLVPDVDALLRDIQKQPKFKPTLLKQPLTWAEVCHIELNRWDLPGVEVEMEYDRLYPFPLECAHIIGYVQTPTERDDVPEQLVNKPDYRLGRTGIEKNFDKFLQGTVGIREIEVNAHRRVMRDIRRTESVQAGTLDLSLSLKTQQFVYQRLAEVHSGAAVVLSIHTGEVLACVSTPSFDSNLFINGIGHEDWQALNTNPFKPLTHKALQGLYPPGSIFKMVVALAALSSGIINSTYQCHCAGYLEVHKHRFHCVHRQGHGSLDVMQALQMSCDVFFYDIALKIGIDRIQHMAALLGFPHITGLELPYEKAGRVPDRQWKRQQLNQSWTAADTIITSIGQGSTLSSPVQMAVLLARLASGRRVIPTLIKNTAFSLPTFDMLPVNPLYLELVRQGLDRAVNREGGTAYASRIINSQGRMAGKTATSQVRRISRAERLSGVLRNEDIEWKRRDHGIFAGYAPVLAPRFALCVLVEHGGGGGRVAAPIARDILIDLQKRDRDGDL